MLNCFLFKPSGFLAALSILYTHDALCGAQQPFTPGPRGILSFMDTIIHPHKTRKKRKRTPYTPTRL